MAVYFDPTPYSVYAGDAWSQDFEFGDGDPAGEDWAPEDLSGLGGWGCQWRTDPDSETAIVLTVDSSRAASGVINISATEAQTRAMGDSGVFDIQASAPRVRTFLRAKTKWTEDVTRD